MARDPREPESEDPDAEEEADGEENEDELEPESDSPPSEPADVASPVAGGERIGWLPLSDPRVLGLDVQQQVYVGTSPTARLRTRYLERIRPPFPVDVITFLRERYGPGRYTLSQRGGGNRYIAAKTFHAPDPQRSAVNGQDAAAGSPKLSTARIPAVSASPVSQDWRVQAIASGGALLTGLLTAVLSQRAQPPQAPVNVLGQLREIAELLAVTNQERAQLFRQGLELARETAGEQNGSGGEGSVGDVATIANAVAEVFKAIRPAGPAPAASQGFTQALALPAPAASVREAESLAQFIERAVVHEIARALATGEGPETLVILLEAWLDPVSLAWLESTDDATVLAELPQRFAGQAEYLKQEPVQTFLRGTLAMLRKDSEEQGDDVPATETAGAGEALTAAG